MDFKKYRRLKKLVANSQDFGSFLQRIAVSPHWFGVPLWTRANYEWFFNRIKGGSNYVTLFTTAA